MRSSSLLLLLGSIVVAVAARFTLSVRRPLAISRGVPDLVPQDHHNTHTINMYYCMKALARLFNRYVETTPHSNRFQTIDVYVDKMGTTMDNSS